METANVLLALGGKRGETVPKYGVTPAEIAVLRFLHGEDSVYEIDPQEATVQRTNRQEIERLRAEYSRRDGERVISPAVDVLFPGVGASVPKTLAELELPEELFAVAERRITKASVDQPKDSLSDLTTNELRLLADNEKVDLTGLTRKADIIEAIELARATKPETPTEDLFK